MGGIFSIDDEVKKVRERLTASLDAADPLVAAFLSEATKLVRELRTEVSAMRRAREAAGLALQVHADLHREAAGSSAVKVTYERGAQG